MNSISSSSDGSPIRIKRRVRTSRWGVRAADRAAGAIITISGIGAILAVMGVCVFLVWVVVPLFLPGDLRSEAAAAVSDVAAPAESLHVGVDEYRNLAWQARADGMVQIWRTDSGARLAERRFAPEDKTLTAAAFALRDGHTALAYDDATLQLGRIAFSARFVPRDDLPADLHQLPPGKTVDYDDGVLERTPEGQFRLQQLSIQLDDPVAVSDTAAVELVDLSVSSQGRTVALLTREGSLRVAQVVERKNVLTGEVTTRLREGETQVDLADGPLPRWLLLSGLGDAVYLIWPDGRLQRYSSRDLNDVHLVETVDLLAAEPANSTNRQTERGELTTVDFLIGKTSLVVGDSLGRVRVWFPIKPDDAPTLDGAVLVMAHNLPGGDAPVRALAPSPRARVLAAAFADGDLRLYHVTSGRQFLATGPGQFNGADLVGLAMSPKGDALLGLTTSELDLWTIDAPHPEANWTSIFGRVWYEGYNAPEHAWQSSGATDDFEPKLGMMPLVFGTVKATVFAMLFGLPLALLAAVYTSEFMHPSTKAKVKPTIEIMASLPSVVLGFLAALVFAPIIERHVTACIAFGVTLPFCCLLGAYLWQLLPGELAVRLRRVRLFGVAASCVAAVFLAQWTAPLIERWFFAGSIMPWLDGQIGTGLGAWMFLLLPLSALAVGFFNINVANPIARRRAASMTRFQFALLELVRFLGNCLLALLLAYVLSWLLTQLGFDPRGTYVGSYVQRNALVVGLIMGFAIIPIIYTISDDALSAVPESLRAGSLGAGATEWQTAVRVVIPTAMSGLFSAVMIGLGRAVGETMIVLMAAGNTPVMDWNIFNGFRTLSANIAVELPEAVQHSTHYRMLFLAALTLFVLTFLVNTVAEAVRQRFRKRAFQL